jgi:hypothetical protein
MESIYHIVTIHVNETSWAHVWRLRSRYLGMGYDSEEGDGAERRAPHGGDVRERRRLCRSAQGRREYAFQKIRQRGLGRVGRAGSRRPAGQSGPARGGARPDGPKSEENSFLNKN